MSTLQEEIQDIEERVDAAVEPEVAPQEAEEAPQPDDSDPDVQFSRMFGWAPKEEWKGDPEKWEDAKAYAARKRATIATVGQLEAKIQTLEASHKDVARRANQMAQAAFKERMRDIQAKERAAVEEGDVQTWEQLQREREQAQPQQGGISQEDQHRIQTWIAERPWMNSDPAASAYARAVNGKFTHLPIAEQLQKVEEEVHRRFPEYAPQKAEPAPKPAAQTVDGGSDSHAARLLNTKREPEFSKLPDVAKDQYREMVREGIFEDTPERRKWAAQKWNE